MKPSGRHIRGRLLPLVWPAGAYWSSMPTRVPSRKPYRIGSANRHADYDRAARDADRKRFYNSTEWRELRAKKLASNPLCEECRRGGLLKAATTVHHLEEVKDYPELKLDWDNLESSCASCHSRHHASKGK